MITLPPTKQKLPLYAQIYQYFKDEIRSGTWRAHEKLPSKRQLAEELRVSVNTVAAAYTQLASEGYIYSRPQSGFYVCEIGALVQADVPVSAPFSSLSPSSVQVDFSSHGVEREHFPYALWRKMLKNCFNEYDPRLLTPSPSQGAACLRESVASYLRQSRGVRCSAEQVVIGAGTSQLLQILNQLFPSVSMFAVENPAYHHAFAIFKQNGRKVMPIDLDEQGLRIAPLSSFPIHAVYVTPSHQFPLGTSMPIGRRIQLLNWANERNGFIIEDDYDSEFRYDSRPLPSLQSIDRNGRVVYLGTFSRSVSPSLRLSYMVLPPTLLSRYRCQSFFGSAISHFEQLVLDEFIRSKHFETHVNKMRGIYREKRAFLVRCLRRELGERIEILGENAGLHLILRVFGNQTAEELASLALAAGAAVYPLSPYFAGDVPPFYRSALLLGYGALSEKEIEHGVSLLSLAWNSAPDSSTS